MTFEKNQKIANYTVVFPHKQSFYAETYRVKDETGNILFLKLISYAQLNAYQYNNDGKVIEVEVAKSLSHNNLCGFVDTGSLAHGGQQFAYIVMNFVSGETVAQKMAREETLTVYETKQVAKSVLKALSFIHSLERPVIHNEVSLQNTLIDLSGELSDAKLIDFGHARFLDMPPSKDDLGNVNPFYLAPERFNGVCSVQSDLFSVGVMMYQMIFGMLPWFIDLSKYKPEDRVRAILARKCSPLQIPSMNVFELNEQLINIMGKAMAYDIKDRFQSAEEFIQAVDGMIQVEKPSSATMKEAPSGKRTKKIGNGFADVAGMTELKEQLRSDVIDLLKNPGRAKELGLSIPNGLLFYGPPGCGKTFFAERFAEEVGCNYMYVLCSDVASPYIHGGQEKISALFEEARKNAPTILFLDEVEAMIMDRYKHNNVSEQGEVNVFLGELNNCGEEGVMVIAATNEPTLIDPAALRAGRLELKYYIPQPDTETRKEIFKIGLKGRNTELGIDYDKLAEMTKDRVSSDIRLIIDTAARIVFKNKIEKITQDILEEAIKIVEPTVSIDKIRKCEKIRNEFTGKKRSRIGFV
ncbi:AAA family ATPase [Bacteroides pyogenes]|uniref:AAA family ATPase n=1 Tax=Bacteroides pyogenes TaxID=310300 RepID=UPI001F4405F1|nr:AAA family ATPase [Bacteroides pyogenes]MCE9105958.1 AAA family ATPase [Bacteroides pyogenes]